MLYKNQIKLNSVLITSVILLCSFFVSAGSPPSPGMPHQFRGTVKDTHGSNVQNDTVVKAVVGNENYTIGVINGKYGYYNPFYVEDLNNINDKKTIYFFVGGIDTNQTYIFSSGSTTELNLTVDLGQNNDTNGDNGAPPSNGDNDDTEPEHMLPVADIGGPYFGIVNKTVLFNASASYDPDGEIVSYSWNFGDGSIGSSVATSHTYVTLGTFNITLLVTDNHDLYDTDEATIKIMYDSDNDSWGDEEEIEYGTDPNNGSDYPDDIDDDHLPDSVDTDNDNDGVPDTVENEIGSNPLDASDVTNILINGIIRYLVDINNDGSPDIFFNSTSGIHTALNFTGNNTYLIDDNGDGVWDYVYNASSGAITQFKEEKEEEVSQYWIYVVAIIILIVILVGVFLKFRNKNMKKKEKK